MKLRRFFALLLCMLFVLSACGPATPAGGTPAGSATSAVVEPQQAIIHNSFTIALPISASTDNKEAHQAFLQRLQNLLWAKGWNVVLADVPMPDDQPVDDLVYTIRTQTVAGKIPDAWRVSPDIAKRLRAAGLTRDMAEVMPTASPMLWDLCKESFRDGADGVPASLTTRTKDEPYGLIMDAAELQAYGAPITSVDDMLTFLEKRPDACILAYSVSLTGAWAAQQGYYSLANYGLPPFFYARMEDADCTPVPAEDIVGFDEFFRRWTALWLKGSLADGRVSNARKHSGTLSSLTGFSAQSLHFSGLQGADMTALPLAGSTQLPRADPPVCSDMLAVPAASQEASTVAALAQWMLLDREGYDLCMYGQQDVDYRLKGEQVEFLKAGKPLAEADWYFDLKNPGAPFYQFASMQGLGFYSEMMRVQKGGVANLEQALAQCAVKAPPLWRIKALRKPFTSLWDIFATTTQPYESVLSQHTGDVNYSAEMVNGVPDRTANQVLQRLRDNRTKLDPLIQDLKKRLRQLLDDPDGDPTQTTSAS